MTTSKYTGFKSRTSSQDEVTRINTSEFIEKSASSVEATRLSDNTEIKAVIISERKEGGNETILFTYADDELLVGEFIQYRNKTYLLYSEYEIIFSEEFKKHKLIECNIELKWETNIQPAYYISSMRAYASLSNFGGQVPYTFSSQQPIIVTKENVNIKTGSRFIVFGEGFVVNDIDRISNQGIYYLSVEQTSVFSDIDDVVDEITQPVPAATRVLALQDIVSGEEVTLSTNFAYAVFSYDVDIVSKSVSEVIFEVPFGVDEIIVDTKDGAGDIITTTYKVVI